MSFIGEGLCSATMGHDRACFVVRPRILGKIFRRWMLSILLTGYERCKNTLNYVRGRLVHRLRVLRYIFRRRFLLTGG